MKVDRKEYLSNLMNELLEKVEEVKDYIIDAFSEDEREEEEIREYWDALSNIEDVIIYYIDL